MSNQSLVGEVKVVTYKNPENGFAVLKVQGKGTKQRFTVTGAFVEVAAGADVLGLEYLFKGSWKEDRQFGKQFVCTSHKLQSDPMYYFLCKFTKGIGETTAKKILAQFTPEETRRILETRSKKLLSVPGVGPKAARKIFKSWKEHVHLQKLSDFFAEYNVDITANLLIKIYKHYGNDATKLLQKDPYSLTEIRGIGFSTADRLAIGTGTNESSRERLKAATLFIMSEISQVEGHTFAEKDEVISRVTELLRGPETFRELIQRSIQDLIQEKKLIFDTKTGWVGDRQVVEAEKYIHEQLVTKKPSIKPAMTKSAAATKIQAFETRHDVTLATDQKKFVTDAISSSASTLVLSGFAGTGKTTVCKTALELLVSSGIKKADIVCCAFTGMAASRIRQVTGFQAKTIHSLLQFSGETFKYNEQKKLPFKVVVLDEASMVNAQLFKSLVEAIGPKTRLMLVGDPAQLAAIGPGNVFGDLVSGKLLPSTQLTRIYRQSETSVLTTFASDIRQGRVPEGVQKQDWSDFTFKRVEPRNIRQMKDSGASETELQKARDDNNMAIQKNVLQEVQNSFKRYKDPKWNVQVLSPMRSGATGTIALNKSLQQILNPSTRFRPEFSQNGVVARVNDKVIHLINKDMPVMKSSSWEGSKVKKFREQKSVETRVFNGAVGEIKAIDSSNDTFVVGYADGRTVQYKNEDFTDLVEHAFALTAHKSQGSQYTEVVLPMTSSHWRMLDTKWTYTAITRATDNVTLIGQNGALRQGCTNLDETMRRTWMSLQAKDEPKITRETLRPAPETVEPPKPVVAEKAPTTSSSNSARLRKLL